MIRQHYDGGDPAEAVAEVARRLAALPNEALTAARLAALDQFHVRGLAATADLARIAGIEPQMTVLDAGSGLGGPARFLAESIGCRVIGVDLSPSFVAVAQLLAERTGVSDRVTFEIGDLAALRFADARFDVVWTQHVLMNVRDRTRIYGEFRRVLKPAGTLAFYDVVADDGGRNVVFPVPWATSATTSFLLTADETVAALTRAGFAVDSWRDVSADGIAAFARAGPPSSDDLSLANVMGPRFGEMATNVARNLREGRIRLVMGRCTAATTPIRPGAPPP
ncbi:MAG TPA: class I SAM-dependent methyltransferase [Gemmatirosa sp.]